MGATLVLLVMDQWGHLPEREYRALMRMAVTALDKPANGKPAAMYYGGHLRIARTWRQPFPHGDTEADRKRRDNILREVRRVCDNLIEAGAIQKAEMEQAVRIGTAQAYHLTLCRAGGHTPCSKSAEEGV